MNKANHLFFLIKQLFPSFFSFFFFSFFSLFTLFSSKEETLQKRGGEFFLCGGKVEVEERVSDREETLLSFAINT